MSFEIFPAVDIKGGRCVRLLRGDMSSETDYGDPVEMAIRWAEEGARWLHLVDLDGAIEGTPVNLAAVSAVIGSVEIPIQLGGGLRNREAVEAALSAGCERAVIGSASVDSPEEVEQIARDHPGRIVLGLDLRGDEPAADGWTRATGTGSSELIQSLYEAPFAAVICTDISRDGAMTGPGIETLRRVLEVAPWPVVASGGISSASDISRVKNVRVGKRRPAGAVVGRALYEGVVTLAELRAAADEG